MDKCCKKLKALSQLTRLNILELLYDGEKNVTDIVKSLKIDQPKVSHHLGILKREGIVADKREGRKIYYSLHPAVFKKISGYAKKIDFGFCSIEFNTRMRSKVKRERTKILSTV